MASGVSVYQPLTDYLAAQGGDCVTLEFARIEQVLGRSLPATAYARSWWHNRPFGHAHTRAWLRVGWRVCHASCLEQTVTFTR